MARVSFSSSSILRGRFQDIGMGRQWCGGYIGGYRVEYLSLLPQHEEEEENKFIRDGNIVREPPHVGPYE